MKKVFTLISFMVYFVVLISGCAMPPTMPEYVDPLAGLGVVTAPAYKDITVGIIISENTKRSHQYGQEMRKWASFDLEKFYDRFSEIFKRNFKAAVKLEKIEDAKTAQVDVIAVLDIYDDIGQQTIKTNANAILLTPDLQQIDAVHGESVKNFAVFGLSVEKLVEDLGIESSRSLENALRSSAKLAEFAKSRTAKPIAKETIAIDIHQIPDFKSTPQPNDLAIIIGIENYQGLPKSDFSKSDAGIVKDYLKALGFAERNIELITDERATKSSIEKSIEAWLPNRVKKDSRVIVYYSGHGAPEPKTGDAYIVPFDGDPNYLEVTGYPLKRLYDRLGKLQAVEVVVLLDSCFSGAGGRSVLAKGARPLVMMTETGILPQNIAVLSAAQGTQISTSSPEKGHGIFTYYFLKALKDGKKNIAEIYEYIKPLVEDEAKQMNVQQSPSVSPDVEKLKGRFGLRK